MQFVDFVQDAKLHQVEYLKAYERVLTSGWYILGKEVDAFEQEFAAYLGVKHVVGVGNGLDAMQISLMALSIGPGDEVITTPLSAIATTLSIIAVGAEPVFVDVDEDGQLNATQIEDKITKKTKAIIPVHLYGNACDIASILDIAQKHNIYVVEDAAQAHGSSHKGKKLGSLGTLGCFSFYPTKNLGTIGGDAGAVATNDSDLAMIIKQIRNYGEQTKYHHIRYGINSRLDEIHAAFLRTKLTWLEVSNQKKRNIASLYDLGLSDLDKIRLVSPRENSISNIHQYVISTEHRDELQKYLMTKGIPTLIHFPVPIHRQPFLASKYSSLNLSSVDKYCATTLSLPSHEFLTKSEVKQVIASIHNFFKLDN